MNSGPQNPYVQVIIPARNEQECIGRCLQSLVSQQGIEVLKLTTSDATNFYQVYATGETSFDGSSLAFVGRYKKSEAQMSLNLSGQYGTGTINLTRTVQLPEFEDTHQHLPRLWARARVEALLQEMNLNGEREDALETALAMQAWTGTSFMRCSASWTALMTMIGTSSHNCS